MRDPDRIDIILEKLRTLWKLAPDQRLGQLIDNIGMSVDRTTLRLTEDDSWEDMIDARIEAWGKRPNPGGNPYLPLNSDGTKKVGFIG